MAEISDQELKMLQERLGELSVTARELSETFNAMADGVSIHSPDFVILDVNNSLCELLGKKREELIGGKCFKIFHDRNNPIDDCPLERTKASKRKEYLEMFEPKFNIWLSILTTPVMSKDGRVIKIIHVVRDITGRKQAEDVLKQKMAEIEKVNKFMVDREIRVVEVKKEVNQLLAELGRPAKYKK